MIRSLAALAIAAGSCHSTGASPALSSATAPGSTAESGPAGLHCGAGTAQVGAQCVPLRCGPGTAQVGNECLVGESTPDPLVGSWISTLAVASPNYLETCEIFPTGEWTHLCLNMNFPSNRWERVSDNHYVLGSYCWATTTFSNDGRSLTLKLYCGPQSAQSLTSELVRNAL